MKFGYDSEDGFGIEDYYRALPTSDEIWPSSFKLEKYAFLQQATPNQLTAYLSDRLLQLGQLVMFSGNVDRLEDRLGDPTGCSDPLDGLEAEISTAAVHAFGAEEYIPMSFQVEPNTQLRNFRKQKKQPWNHPDLIFDVEQKIGDYQRMTPHELCVVVDLEQSDTEILSQVKNIVNSERQKRLIRKASLRSSESLSKKIVECKIIPIMDLMAWFMFTGSRPTDMRLAEQVFSDAKSNLDTFGKTVKPLLSKMLIGPFQKEFRALYRP